MTARSLNLPSQPTETKKIGNARPIQVSDKDISRFESLINAPLKGIAKMTVGLGRLGAVALDPTNLLGKYTQPLLDKAEEEIEKRIPTQSHYLEKSIERGTGPALLGAATGGVLPAITGLASGFAGQAVEEAGGGPLLQGAAELATQGLPGLGRRIIPSSRDQQRILNLGRTHGMTEEQLAPLMPEVGKKRHFGRFAYASEGSQEALRETRRGVQNIYDNISQRFAAQPPLSQNASRQFVQDTSRIMHNLPANIRNQVAQDARELFQAAQQRGGFSGDELINWYHDISNRYHLDRSALELLKNPVRNALRSVNPQLAEEFEVTNRMYQKATQIGRILRPGEYEHLISLGEAYEMGAAAANLDAGRLTRLLGMMGYRKFSEKMLTSPRLQNIIEKAQDAILRNSPNMLKKLGELILNEFKEEDEEKEG